MLRFPLDGLLDEQACYDFLLRILHPDGLYCPHGHVLPADQAPHRRRRPVIPDYRCRKCGAVFNLFTGTIWWKTCYRCSTIVQILRGIAQGTPTQHLADELSINRTHLLSRRHEIHTLIGEHFSPYQAIGRSSNNTFAKIEVARKRLLSYRWVSRKQPQRRNDKSLCRTL